MKRLTTEEEKMLHRYQRCSNSQDSYFLLKSSALASNKLIITIEATFDNREITGKQYGFLAMLSERKSRNYKVLSGVDVIIKFFEAVKEASFDQIKIEETT